MKLEKIRDWSGVTEFEDRYGTTFKSCKTSCRTLNNLLETKYKKVFRESSSQWGSINLDWSCETIYVLTEKNRVLMFTNSEWASFNVEGVISK